MWREEKRGEINGCAAESGGESRYTTFSRQAASTSCARFLSLYSGNQDRASTGARQGLETSSGSAAAGIRSARPRCEGFVRHCCRPELDRAARSTTKSIRQSSAAPRAAPQPLVFNGARPHPTGQHHSTTASGVGAAASAGWEGCGSAAVVNWWGELAWCRELPGPALPPTAIWRSTCTGRDGCRRREASGAGVAALRMSTHAQTRPGSWPWPCERGTPWRTWLDAWIYAEFERWERLALFGLLQRSLEHAPRDEKFVCIEY